MSFLDLSVGEIILYLIMLGINIYLILNAPEEENEQLKNK